MDHVVGLRSSEAGMRRLAEDGNTTHELMAISGHKTLTEVQRYTADADRKLRARSRHGAEAQRLEREHEVTNLAAGLYKPAVKSLKTKD